jgi:uncharacterized protein YukE
MAEGAPHPGARPLQFQFPFAEAEDALAAIADAIAELQSMVSVHDSAVVSARVNFEGQTRDGFDQGFEQLMAETDSGIQLLENQRSDLEDDIQTAHRRQADSLDAIEDWGQAMQRYREASALQAQGVP